MVRMSSQTRISSSDAALGNGSTIHFSTSHSVLVSSSRAVLESECISTVSPPLFSMHGHFLCGLLVCRKGGKKNSTAGEKNCEAHWACQACEAASSHAAVRRRGKDRELIWGLIV